MWRRGIPHTGTSTMAVRYGRHFSLPISPLTRTTHLAIGNRAELPLFRRRPFMGRGKARSGRSTRHDNPPASQSHPTQTRPRIIGAAFRIHLRAAFRFTATMAVVPKSNGMLPSLGSRQDISIGTIRSEEHTSELQSRFG